MTMMAISQWAYSKPLQARIALLVLKVVQYSITLIAALVFLWSNFKAPPILYLVFIALAAWAAYHYPNAAKRGRKKNYLVWKSCDFTLSMCTVGLLFLLISGTPRLEINNVTHAASLTLKRDRIEEVKHKSTTTFKKLVNKAGRFFEKVKSRVQDYTKLKVALLIFLAIIATLAAGVLIAAIACGLACDGLEVLAVIVAIVGIAGVITGSIFLIRSIVRWGKKRMGQG